MAYQNVIKPRFYIDHGAWLSSLGEWNPELFTEDGQGVILPTYMPSIFQLNPSNQTNFSSPNTANSIIVHLPRKAPIKYIAILGHDIKSKAVQGQGTFATWDGLNNITSITDINMGNLHAGLSNQTQWDGFSLATFIDIGEDASEIQLTIEDSNNVNIGAISIGSYYDMTSPSNLSLNINREYGGTKEFSTYNGSSMSNTLWNKPPMWGNLGAWELYNPDIAPPPQELSRSGRRVWDLEFSYMDNGSLFGPNQLLSSYLNTSTGYSMADLSWSSPENATFSEGTNPPNIHLYQEHWGFTVPGGNIFDPYTWIGPNGIFVTQDIDVADIPTDFSEFALKINGITGAGLGTQNIGLPDSDLFIGSLLTLETGKYYIVDIVAGTADFTTELFNTNTVTDFGYNLLNHNNFFSQVWHKTLGGTLPFIFQPDSSNNNPDQFSICRFVNNSLKATQTAFNVYDISVSIEEVW